MGRVKKQKKITIEFVDRLDEFGAVKEPYRIMENIIRTKRADLVEASLGIAWRLGWKRDKDRLLKCGKCCKRNELDRNLSVYDFVILLNAEAWPTFTPKQRERLIFHELEHAVIVTEDGMPKRDEKGRLVTRVRKHDIQDFRSVVEEYGWDEDLSDLAVKGIADADRPLLNMRGGSGSITTTQARNIVTVYDKKKPPEAEDFTEDPGPGEQGRNPESQTDPATGTPDAYNIILKGAKKIGLTGSIFIRRNESDRAEWQADYRIEAGRQTIERDRNKAAMEAFRTAAQAADAMCTDIVERLGKLTETEYAFAGAAASRVKKVVQKWIDAMPEA